MRWLLGKTVSDILVSDSVRVSERSDPMLFSNEALRWSSTINDFAPAKMLLEFLLVSDNFKFVRFLSDGYWVGVYCPIRPL